MSEPFTIRLRKSYGGTSLMSRGDRREAIYGNNVDRQDFFKSLGGKNGKRMNRR